MRHIPNKLRHLVITRAGNRCEYCGLSQLGQAATFHIDHVTPVAAGGLTRADNLALACVACSLYKAARQVFPDPLTGEPASIFNPRQESWADHFVWEGVHVNGLTPTGRATVTALQMNRPLILVIREEEKLIGRHPG
jgi:hypothetical protein